MTPPQASLVALLRKAARNVDENKAYTGCCSAIDMLSPSCTLRCAAFTLLRRMAPTLAEAFPAIKHDEPDRQMHTGVYWWTVASSEDYATNTSERQMFLLFLAEFVEGMSIPELDEFFGSNI